MLINVLHFLDPYVEDDLNPHLLPSLQVCCCISLTQPGLTDGLQLLSHSHTPGFTQSDPGSVGLPASERDSFEEVLPGGQCSIQVLIGGPERNPVSGCP